MRYFYNTNNLWKMQLSSTLKLLIFIVSLRISTSETDKLFCYYGSWATYRQYPGRVSVEDIDPNICSHIIYSFVGLNPDGSVLILDPWNEIQNAALARFIDLKQQNPILKLLVAIGGWNEGSVKYSNVINSNSLRSKFVDSILNFVLQYKFDGFELDWEYPGQRGGAESDRVAYVQLLQELRPKFDQHQLLLTAAVGASRSFHSTSYDVPNLSRYLDFINIMTYDFHGSYDGVTGQNSPLFASSIDWNRELNVNSAIQGWIQAGTNPEKIILGIALYGRTFTLANPSVHALGSPTVGPGNPGSYTAEPGMLSFLEICEKLNTNAWTLVWDNEQGNPYAFNGNQWIGYDDERSVALKAEYAIRNGLGGVMVWSLESDDVRNVCGKGRYPLMRAIGNVFNFANNGNGSLTTTTSATTTDSSTITTSTLVKSTTTTAIPSTTTAFPGNPSCTAPGYIRDSSDCGVFYQCIPNGDGSYRAVRFVCPTGLKYDLIYKICNYPQYVQC